MDRRQNALLVAVTALAAGSLLLGSATATDAEAVAACEARAGKAASPERPEFLNPRAETTGDLVKVYGSTLDGGDLWCMVDVERKRLMFVTHNVRLMTFKDSEGQRYDVQPPGVDGVVEDVDTGNGPLG